MADIRLFVCCHKKSDLPRHPLLVPVQVGAALAGERFPGFFYDDTGDNISLQNRTYCELTAHYWAWKNVKADYYGFFHYRRYLYPDQEAKRPYRIERGPNEEVLDRLDFDDFPALIGKYDLILPMAENMQRSVREHYARAAGQLGEDLALVENIIRERHPEMAGALESYLTGNKQYFGNIFIMRQEIFSDYCAWLFPILWEFDTRARDILPRTDGYLAERLLGVYAAEHRDGLSVCELPRAHFYSGGEYAKKRLLNVILPPGTKRRAAVRRMAGR